MGKSTHFIGQPLFSQIIKLIGRENIRRISHEYGGERYVKRFDCWTHLVVMLYAVIMRFDSLREIAASMQAEARKLCHLGIRMMPSRSTLADANRRRSSDIFEPIYSYLYARYSQRLSSDSRRGGAPKWMSRLQIIDSTTVTLFSNLLFKGAGRNPKSGRKKGGIKVHTVIHANDGVPSDIRFTSAATRVYYRHLPPAVGDRAAIQADKAEFSPEILLRRERQRHQDTNMGDAHRQPPADGHAQRSDTSVELLRTRHNGQNNPDVLR